MSKYVEIKLDKTRNLRYGMAATLKVDRILGRGCMLDDEKMSSIEAQATMLWAGLVHEDPELTVDKVAELVDEHSDMTTAFEKMQEAMILGYGKSEKATTGKKK